MDNNEVNNTKNLEDTKPKIALEKKAEKKAREKSKKGKSPRDLKKPKPCW